MSNRSKYTDSFAFAAKVRESDPMTTKHRPVLDDTSRAIIEQLQIDGRKPYAAIGLAVGLSEAAVRQRIAKLIESGGHASGRRHRSTHRRFISNGDDRYQN